MSGTHVQVVLGIAMVRVENVDLHRWAPKLIYCQHQQGRDCDPGGGRAGEGEVQRGAQGGDGLQPDGQVPLRHDVMCNISRNVPQF